MPTDGLDFDAADFGGLGVSPTVPASQKTDPPVYVPPPPDASTAFGTEVTPPAATAGTCSAATSASEQPLLDPVERERIRLQDPTQDSMGAINPPMPLPELEKTADLVESSRMSTTEQLQEAEGELHELD